MTAPSPDDLPSALPDLTAVLLVDLLDVTSPELTAAMRRRLAEADSPQEAVAGFQSAI